MSQMAHRVIEPNGEAVEVNRRVRALVTTLTWIGGVLVFIAGLIWFASALNSKVETTNSTVGDHETRLRAVESTCTETRNDVKWIRKALGGGGGPPTGAASTGKGGGDAD